MSSKTFDELYHVTRRGLWPRLRRDVRLAAHLAGIAWKNATIGRRVRRDYLARRARGEPYWLDEPSSGSGGAH